MSDASKVSAEVNGSEPFAEARGSAGELSNLRRRVKAQRAELRRLNKELSGKAAYWRGFDRGLTVNSLAEMRGKMNKAFGHKAVWEAERGEPYPEHHQPNEKLSD